MSPPSSACGAVGLDGVIVTGGFGAGFGVIAAVGAGPVGTGAGAIVTAGLGSSFAADAAGSVCGVSTFASAAGALGVLDTLGVLAAPASLELEDEPGFSIWRKRLSKSR